MRTGDERSDYAPFERSADGVGYVYFLGSANGQRIKIGYSGEVTPKRLKQHARGDAFGHGSKFTVLAMVRATQQAEGALHSYYRSALAANNEVYLAEKLLSYVAWLRDLYFVATTWDELLAAPVMDVSLWLPGPGKESDRRSELSLLTECDPWDILPTRVRTGDDYYTPEHFLACIRAALGGVIDLDPASHVMANEKVKAARFFTKDQNGLVQPWSGRVFLNPPFSSWPLWVDKVLAEVRAGNVEAMVMLGATRTLTAQYFTPLLRRSDAVCVISGRTAFWGVETESDSPTDGHFLLYIGPAVAQFVAATTPLGATWPKHAASFMEATA